MALVFTPAEYAARIHVAAERLRAADLDGLLIFRQESMYYLTGYDTSGYSMFQGMLLTADGRVALLTRTADRIQSRATSVVEDIRIWYDHEGANPAIDLRAMLADYGLHNQRLGVEYHAYGLTGQRAKLVDAALSDFCELSDASDLIRQQRLVKSPAELDYVRAAGAISDEILAIARAKVAPGVATKSIYADMLHAVLSAGGDPSASRWPLGAGEQALFGRYHTGNEAISANDNVCFEPAASIRHYHSCQMFNIVTGVATAMQRRMHNACCDALDACLETLRPANTVGELYAAHGKTLDSAGFADARLAACGYTLGATYPPTWMDWPMVWADNPQVLETGMVFFLHMILFDEVSGTSMCLGETAIVGSDACERINHLPRELMVN